MLEVNEQLLVSGEKQLYLVPTTILFCTRIPKPSKSIENAPPKAKRQCSGDHSYHSLKKKPTQGHPESETIIQTVTFKANDRVMWTFHKCRLCPYKSKSMHLMKLHSRRHKVTKHSKKFTCSVNNVEHYKCSRCKYKSALLINFKKHLEAAHQPLNKTANRKVYGNLNFINLLKTYACEHCSFKSSSQLLYINHYSKCPVASYIGKEDKRYEIEFVKKYDIERRMHVIKTNNNVIQRKKFQAPLKRVPSPPVFKCTKCPYVCKREMSLQGHVQVAHPSREVTKMIPLKRGSYYFCELCPYKSKFRHSTVRHSDVHIRNRDKVWLDCRCCPFRTLWPRSLYNHKQLHLGKPALAEESEIPSELLPAIEPFPNGSSEPAEPQGSGEADEPTPRETTDPPTEKPIENPVIVIDDSPQKTQNKLKPGKIENPVVATDDSPQKPQKKKLKPGKKYYICIKCNFKTESKIGYANHLAFRHASDGDVGWLRCTKCSYKTIFSHRFQIHTDLHRSKNSLLKCNLCNFQSKSKGHLHTHMCETHLQSVAKIKTSTATSWFKCESGDYKTKNHRSLKDHILTKHVTSETVTCYICKLCTYRTLEEGEMNTHVLEKHVDPQYTDWCQCEMCPDKFKDGGELKAHIMKKHIL